MSPALAVMDSLETLVSLVLLEQRSKFHVESFKALLLRAHFLPSVLYHAMKFLFMKP